eukprot:8309573-Pyramimonas_sp.AAC.1
MHRWQRWQAAELDWRCPPTSEAQSGWHELWATAWQLCDTGQVPPDTEGSTWPNKLRTPLDK